MTRTVRNGATGWAPPPVKPSIIAGLSTGIIAAAAVVLALLGRSIIGGPTVPVVVGPAGGTDGSQSFLDAYTLLHLVWGMVLRVAIRPRTGHWPTGWLIVVAFASTALWEIVENMPGVIARFGDAPGSPHYLGDSIVNSIGDMLAAVAGFAAAARLKVAWVAASVVAADVLLMALGLDGVLSAGVRLVLAR